MSLLRPLFHPCRAAVLAMTLATAGAQPLVHNTPIPAGTGPQEIIRLAANLAPSSRQLDYLALDFTCFVHFGVNTYTGNEWGSGKESPAIFNPGETLDTDQWCRTAKAAGMKLMLITVKHHDGFCMWQSRYNPTFSLRSIPWRGGRGDVLRELSASCRKHGLKLGVYLSPADLYQMESPAGLYGNGSKPRRSTIPTDPAAFLTDPAKPRTDRRAGAPVIEAMADDYNRYFMNQLYELLTEYGPIHEVWFDGAHPKQKGGQTYIKADWFAMIRKLAPQAVIFGGPDVRWCGNEAGATRDPEWNVLPVASDDQSGIDRPQRDIGSDHAITQPDYEVYGKKYPSKFLYYLVSEVDTSIRAGWFWRNEHEQSVRSPDDVFDIYERTTGGNSVLLLNVPPDKSGRFAPRDTACLEEVGRRITATYGNRELMRGATATAPKLLDQDPATWWQAPATTCETELRLPEARRINRVIVQEAVGAVGQRVATHAVDAWTDGKWREIATGTTIGYRKILRFPAVSTDRIRLRVTAARAAPAIATLAVALYQAPLPVPTIARGAGGKVVITAGGGAKGFGWKPHGQGDPSAPRDLAIAFTTDGSQPTAASTRYTGPIDLPDGGLVRAAALAGDTVGATGEALLEISPAGWTVVTAAAGHSAEFAPAMAIDGNPATYWHTSWNQPVPVHPHALVVDTGRARQIRGFTYLPRQDRAVPDGMVERGTIEFSPDGTTWSAAVPFHFGNLTNDPAKRTLLLPAPVTARYFRFTSREGAAGKPYAAAAEIGILPGTGR